MAESVVLKYKQLDIKKRLILEQFFFNKTRYPSSKQKLHLAEKLEISLQKIQDWFQNYRCKQKRGLYKMRINFLMH
jgi:Homeodomain